MKLARVFAMVLLAAVPALGVEPSPGAPELTSLHGTMITMISETEGVPAEIWAKGDKVRSETAAGDEQKVITIQRGNSMYVFGRGSTKGDKYRFEMGLASLGLIQQIALVKAKGKKEATQEIEGVEYDKYNYDVDAPQEWAVAFLATKTSLPKFWISAVRTGETKALAVRMHYRDMEANVDVPDAMFELPRDVEFTDVPTAELMATAQLLGGKQPPAAPPAEQSPNPSDDATH